MVTVWAISTIARYWKMAHQASIAVGELFVDAIPTHVGARTRTTCKTSRQPTNMVVLKESL